jgi:hypothetical protein
MIDCPAYYGDGVCVTGCWEEPRCITDEPEGGWLRAESIGLREAAWENRGDHGLVKHIRDLTRETEKREVRLLLDCQRKQSNRSSN